MAIQGLNHITLRAQQPLLDTLKAFYCDVLQLKEGQRPSFSDVGYWLYAGKQPLVHLYEVPAQESIQITVKNAFDHIAFTCQYVSVTEEHLQCKGIMYRKECVPGTEQIQLFFKDPANNKIELCFPVGAI